MMLQKLLVFPLALILSLTTPGRVTYAKTQVRDAAYTSKVKADIARRRTSNQARVTIKLHNGQELKGRIDQTNDNTFTLRDEKTGKSINVAYGEVKRVRGPDLNKGKKIGIIAALAVGVVVLVGVLSFKNFHPFEKRGTSLK